MNILSIPYSLISEWICLIISILLLKNSSPRFWQVFIPYLMLTVAIETYAYISITQFGNKTTHNLYNIFLFIYLNFHLYLFSKIINLKSAYRIVFLCLILLYGIYLMEWLLTTHSFLSITNTIFGGVIILLSIIYYFSLFIEDEMKQSEFWFVTGCLIFYSFTTGVNAFFDQLPWLNQNIGIVPIRYFIISISNIIMYGCWIKSFLCIKDKKIYFQQ
jgi:hypothetical protein